MTKADSDPWEALRRVYDPARNRSNDPGRSVEARRSSGLDELRQDLAEERAAIQEYEGGLSRSTAESLAYEAQGLCAPKPAKD